MQQRSSLTAWLLLAATLSVDIVVLSLLMASPVPSATYVIVVAHALIVGQLSVVCVWSALCSAPNLWSRTAPYFAAVLTAIVAGLSMRVTNQLTIWSTFTNFLGYFGLHAVTLLAAMWLLQRTGYWRRRTGISHTWQFSIFHVLIVMTLTAVLLALLRNNIFLAAGRWDNFTVAFCCLALAIASVFLWSMPWNWFLRLASVIGAAALVGAVTVTIFIAPTTRDNFNVFNILNAYYVIQAVVLSLWLGIAPILPPRIDRTAV